MRLFALAMLMMFSIGAEAKIDVQIANDGKFDGGTIEVTNQKDLTDGVEVTITVTPKDGYTIKKSAITVVSTYPPSGNSSTRTPEIANNLTLYYNGSAEKDVDDTTAKRDYTFKVPTGFGAWVKEATFQSSGKKDGNEPTRTTDYSGTYYIASKRVYDSNNTSNNFYLCPTVGWAFYVATNKVQADDNGQPFLTTYMCKTNSYDDVKKAVWNVEKDPSSGCYYIKQALTGRYMVSNGVLTGAGNTRARVHLETVANADALATLGDWALFEITYDNTNATYPDHYDILPHSTYGRDGDNIYLTVNTNNYNYLYGTDAKKNGPTGFKNCGGIIGLYTHPDDGNACFYLEPALSISRPTITNNFNGTFTIAAATGATIYYTTDGTEPTISTTTFGTTSVTVSQTADMSVIKAIAKAADDAFPTIARTYNLPRCERPVISVSGTTATLTCSTPDVSFFWTNDPDATPETSCTSPFDIGNNSVFKVIARKQGYVDSYPAYYTQQVTVHSTDEMNMIGSFLLADDFKVKATLGSESNPFVGTIDGQYNPISLQGHPLVAYANGATIKNVIVSSVNISSGTNVGAICNEADGDTKIYNCGVISGSVSGSSNVGGLVGLIKSGSKVRVVNCYNYATVSGGSSMAGIVGNNQGTVGDVRIAMCMMYGNMSGGTSPVYAGNHISNNQNFSEYNYWRSKANLTYSVYNDQLAIVNDDYLTRWPFYRHILNTHRELAAYFIFGDYSASHVAEVGHWVLKKGENAPAYPVIEEWATNTKRTTVDIAASLPNTTEANAGKLLTNMGTSGYLSVTVKIGTEGMASGSSAIETTVNLPITDMDVAKHDYTYGKVVLPFANEFRNSNNEVWTPDYSKICTGWKITKVGTQESFSIPQNEPYNFADRNNPNKDVYNATNNPYIFAQGGNYIVPYGVSSITIEANFANAFYLSDPQYERAYDATSTTPTNLGGAVSATYHDKTVDTSLSTVVGKLSKSTNPHDQAIVLVGNFHYVVGNANQVYLATDKAVTIMSVDEDRNQEPDYGWYSANSYGRLEVPPLRFDFLPNIEIGMASRVTGSTYYPGIGLWHTRGWFELTETCVSNMVQCEINSDNFSNSDNGSGNNRWIANSGCFDQITRARDGNCTKLSYIQIGGNAYVKSLYPGSHTDNGRASTAVPILVMGGQVDECFMTGNTAKGANNNTQGTLTGNMIYFWCAGGKIKKFLGAYMENPVSAGLTAKIDHANIGRFFGGGTSAAARIKGDINITINNSMVDFYCGGPEFGDMYDGKKVRTEATGTTFGEYYGAGFGGTSITYNREAQKHDVVISAATVEYPLGFTNYTNHMDYTTGFGFGTCYSFDYLFNSNGKQAVARFYTGYAQFSLATTGSVINILNNCIIKKLPGTNSPTVKETSGDFYGAGCQGKVNGTVTTTLTGCTLERSAYGGGYKATSNNVEVYTTTQPTYAIYTKETGVFGDFGTVAPETYTWEQGDATTQNTKDENGKKLYTSKDLIMTDLGNVTGAISITIDGGYVGGTSVGMTPATAATATSEAIPAGGNVYGGGNESKSLSDTTVTLKGNAVVYGDVFGGGNKAEVGGTAKVNIMYEEE